MKKWTALLFVLIAIVSFLILFNKENYNQLYKMRNAEKTEQSYRILLSVGDKQQEDIYKALKAMLDKYQGNIYTTELIREDNRTGHIKYVYLTDLDYFQNFKLSKGRFWDVTENESEKFLSTKQTGDNRQIGQLSDFAGNDIFEIRTLKNMLNTGKNFEGNYILQLNKGKSIDSFIKELEANYGIYAQKLPIYAEGGGLFPFEVILVVLFLIIILLEFYDVLNSYKKIGIEKLLGYSKVSIWQKRVIPLVLLQIIIVSAATCFLTIYKFNEYNQYFYAFIQKLIFFNGLIILITFISISIPFTYAGKITISNMLKNKRPVRAIVLFNNIIKIGLTIPFLILAINAYSKFTIISSLYNESLKQWEATKQYAIMPLIRDVTNDYLTSDKFRQSQKELYFYFNEQGSILADFSEFSPQIRELRKKETQTDYQRDNVTVNPNYLKVNDVFDVKGNKIQISESDTEYVLLIPEKYRSYEGELREFYQFRKNGSISIINGKKVPTIVKDQKIKIIWTRNNQKLFTYRIDINPKAGNTVTDPIIRVITQSNGSMTDYDRIVAYSGNPFKIKIKDTLNPDDSIRPKLKEYNMDRYIPTIVSVYDFVADEAKESKDAMLFMLFIMIILGSMMIIIIVQNIYNYFEQYKRRLVIQKFLGHKKIDKYKGYYLLTCFSWFIVLIISKLTKLQKSSEFLISAIFLVGIEIGVSLVVLRFVEKRKILKVTKGG